MKANQGIKNLVRESRRVFRVRENILYYSPEDFEAAERKFIKFVLEKGFRHITTENTERILG